MAFDYNAAASDALALIKEFGAPLPIKRVTNTPDPVQGSVVATETAGNLSAVVLPAKATADNAVMGTADNRIAEALTKGKIRFVIAAAKGAPFAPDSNDLVTFENETWSVVASVPLAPAGVPVIYKFGMLRT